MNDAMQYAIFAAIGGYFGWYADDIFRWVKKKFKQPGGE